MTLEQAFPNDPHFVAKRVATELISSLEIPLGKTIARKLLEHCEPLRPDDPQPYAWISKKARDGIQAALEETLFKAMNIELGLPVDYRP